MTKIDKFFETTTKQQKPAQQFYEEAKIWKFK